MNFQHSYEFAVGGLEVTNQTHFSIPKYKLDAVLKASKPLRLDISLGAADESSTAGRAEYFAAEVYQRFLLRFGENIERAEPPHLVDSTPSAPRVNSNASKSLVVVGSGDLEALAREVELRVVTPQPATSAQLYTALDMYTVALQSANKVVRFLVLYSALSLAALFKWHSGSQERVDDLLLGVEPNVPVTPSPPPRKGMETLYTKLRNDFIHAEERSRDVTSAIAAIETHARKFQQLVSQVLLGM